MKKFIQSALFTILASAIFWPTIAWAVDIVHITNSTTMGMKAYNVSFDVTSAADGSWSFDFSTDDAEGTTGDAGTGVLAKMFTKEHSGAIVPDSIKIALAAAPNTPTTLFDAYLYDSSSGTKKDLLEGSGVDLVVTEDAYPKLTNDGGAAYIPLNSPPVLTLANMGDSKVVTISFTVLR